MTAEEAIKTVAADYLGEGYANGLLKEILSALDAAGYAVVPKEPDENMLEKGRKAWKAKRLHVSHQGSDEFMTCGVIYRAMIDAAKE